jgi:short-subunit dehydrogenase
MAASYPFRSALVTGASSGIGEEITRRLAAAGVPVVAVARRADRLAALAEGSDRVEVLVADLGRREDQARVAARIADEDQPIELVVNNAGFGTSGSFEQLDLDRLSDEIALNVDALTRLTHAALAAMVPRRRGWVLNVSSFASFQPAPRLAVYAATKAYVTSLGESLHEEVKASGVVVTTLCPGLVRTEFQSISGTGHYQTEFPDVLWLPLPEVVTAALEATAKGRAIVVPGALYKGASWAVGITPRWLRRVASGRVQRT